MKILTMFQQPARDTNTYVVVEGAASDIACYRSEGPTISTAHHLARFGLKLSETEFRATMGCWNFEADGLHYRA